jgi:hypothetical protein
MLELNIKRDDFVEALSVEIDIFFGKGWFLDTHTGDILLHGDGVENLQEDFPHGERYLNIETLPSDEAFQIMLDFVEQLDDQQFALHLSEVLKKPKPFRNFKLALEDNESFRDAWFVFELDQLTGLAEKWCADNDIHVTWI